jgi:hypothetical protein
VRLVSINKPERRYPLTDHVRIDEHWHYRGLRSLVVENSQLRLVILPELGGKLWSLVYKLHDREIFWHHPRVEPRPSPYGAAYDDAQARWGDCA